MTLAVSAKTTPELSVSIEAVTNAATLDITNSYNLYRLSRIIEKQSKPAAANKRQCL
ncbi:hypothetical protein GCM10011328_27060 [Hafnia psychrotolerans]|uniref:Uncharacterized protein n=1 Tax=Hafnia psychrotolerans TaxID=1477018 RepID=A0ABQ1GUX3_9GAMM|nr:hypothetical protein GCM10011328_27060 [Hafnia psychrotolerans]